MEDRKNESPLDVDNSVAKGAIDRNSEHQTEIGTDDAPNTKAMREAVRQHVDAFIVRSDLEDEDEREAAPGTREEE